MSSCLYQVNNGKLTLSLHPGQEEAYYSTRRIIAVVAGTQGGKTSFSVPWLWNEIRHRGPGDYAYISPVFTLMEQKALPEFKAFFQHTLNLGQYVGSPVRKFTFSPEGRAAIFGRPVDTPTHVYFGYAENPDSLESATYKGVVCDEAGQKAFKRDSWEAINRRVAIHQGRILITTTPYSNAGWLRTEIYDRWAAGDRDIAFIRFASIMNPAFPLEEYERARGMLPGWKFRMMYDAAFERPAGMIYDCFDEAKHKCPPFKIPEKWPRFLGLDFGGVNTCGMFYAQEPGTDNLYAYREYHPREHRTAKDHVEALKKGEPGLPIAVGGSRSEQQWRDEFSAAGMPVMECPITEVEVGIDRVYGCHKEDGLRVFSDLKGYMEEKLTYARELDERGEPTEKIEAKETFHHMDAERYIISWLRRNAGPWKPTSDDKARTRMSQAPPGVFRG